MDRDCYTVAREWETENVYFELAGKYSSAKENLSQTRRSGVERCVHLLLLGIIVDTWISFVLTFYPMTIYLCIFSNCSIIFFNFHSSPISLSIYSISGSVSISSISSSNSHGNPFLVGRAARCTSKGKGERKGVWYLLSRVWHLLVHCS